MGARKRLMAERLKEIKKQTAIAKLNNEPSSPRKMRLVADIVRGVEVNRAMDILRYSKKAASRPLEKLIKSAVANWEAKNPDKTSELENGNVIVKTIMVDEGRTLKRRRNKLWDRKQILSATESVSPVVGTLTGVVVNMRRR